MRVEFIGLAGTADQTELIARVGPAVEPDYLYRLAVAHEQSGFDRVLVTHGPAAPDPFVVADQVLGVTARLGVLVGHRPVAPAAAARMLATLDAFHPGRVALHVGAGTGEFIDVVRQAWARSAVRRRGGQLPVYAGASRADVYGLPAEPPAAIRQRVARVRVAAAAAGRAISRFSVSLRLVAADTEADAIRQAGVLRELAAEAAGPALLVGSHEQVAQALLRYVAAGVSTLLISGYDPLAAAVAHASVIRLVHERVGEDVEGYRARAAA